MDGTPSRSIVVLSRLRRAEVSGDFGDVVHPGEPIEGPERFPGRPFAEGFRPTPHELLAAFVVGEGVLVGARRLLLDELVCRAGRGLDGDRCGVRGVGTTVVDAETHPFANDLNRRIGAGLHVERVEIGSSNVRSRATSPSQRPHRRYRAEIACQHGRTRPYCFHRQHLQRSSASPLRSCGLVPG